MDTFTDHEQTLASAMPEAKAVAGSMLCPVHGKKVRLSFDYDDNGANAYLVGYCCRQHAETVAQAIEDAQILDNVKIEDQQ